MIRQDKFQVGDRVEFVEEDEYTGIGMAQCHKRRHGLGPYLIQEIEDIYPTSYKSSGHTQRVIINDEGYSGWWFKPVREVETAQG